MCHACGFSLNGKDRIGFRDVCPQCGKSLHVCLNCRFYKPGAHWDCVETVSEPVSDKEKGNFCEWFVLSKTAGAGEGPGDAQTKNERSRFDDLFKN